MNIAKINGFVFIISTLLTTFGSLTANAQYGGSNSFSNMVIRHNIQRNNLNNRILNNMRANKMIRDNYNERKGINTNSSNTSTPKAPPRAVSIFDASPQRIVTKGVTDQTTKALYEEALCSYENVAKKDGFMSNDIAYALNYYLVHNYVIYHNLYGEVENASDDPLIYLQQSYAKKSMQVHLSYEHAVHQQFQQFIEVNEYFKSMNNAQKQEVAESLAVTTGMLWMLYADFLKTKDYSVYPEIRQTAYDNLKALLGENVDVNKLRVGFSGMRFE